MTEIDSYYIFTFDDICFEISKHLSYIELLNFSLHFPKLKLKPPKFKYILQKKMKMLGINYIEFMNQIVSTESCISGSFILQCLLSKYTDTIVWKSDIDVFTKYYSQKCNHCNIQVGAGGTSSFSEYLCKNGTINEMAPLSQTNNFISASRAWNLNNAIINDITLDLTRDDALDIPDIKTFVFDSFDFDFCKVIYDGNKLTIYNIDSVLFKNTTYSFNFDIEKKYGKGHYPFYSQCLLTTKILKALDKRFDKYTARSFNIALDHNIESALLHDYALMKTIYSDEQLTDTLVYHLINKFNIQITEDKLDKFKNIKSRYGSVLNDDSDFD